MSFVNKIFNQNRKFKETAFININNKQREARQLFQQIRLLLFFFLFTTHWLYQARILRM